MRLTRVPGQPFDALVDHGNGGRGRRCVFGAVAFIVALALGILAAPLLAEAQGSAKVPRVGMSG